ncbi:peptidoglycan-binding protein [Streptomyces polyrhachis]|uniref:Peptidoglycan-binding protein n=1 Tax=Streptomyces polyrhachis TaxID=1282885 RepID=A0ABW2GDD1_9ACTN
MRRPVLRSTLVAAVAAASALGVLGTTPASANTTDGYVSGGGDFTNDWDDEGVLSVNSYGSSNATCMWQLILVAEGLLASEQIDGEFEVATYQATKEWQMRYLGADYANGIVGQETFGRADDNLVNSTFGKTGAPYWYEGEQGVVRVWRGNDGRYHFSDAGIDRIAGYDYRTCS